MVTITATGIANNRFVRHGAYTTRVTLSRMNEALQRVVRQGGRVVSVVVSGEGELESVKVTVTEQADKKPAATASKGRSRHKKA